MKYSRLQSDCVVEVIDLPDDLKPKDAFHPEIAALFVPCPDEVSIGWRYENGVFSKDQASETNLNAFKSAIKASIDTLAESERGKYITPGAGQALTYQRKVEEARSAMIEENPLPSDYPMLAASLGFDGNAIKEIAVVVLEMDKAWATAGGRIERVRIQAKNSVDLATSEDAAIDVLAMIDWTEK